MMGEESMEEESLLKDFIVEAEEHLEDIEQKTMELEKQGEDAELINSVFRSFHTIKGNAKWLGFEQIVTLTHAGESLLGDLRNNILKISPSIIDIILKVRDATQDYIDQVKTGDQPEKDIADLLSAIEKERGKRSSGG